MRILHLIPSLTGGGAERQLAYLAPALAEAGVDVHVGYIGSGPNLARLRESAVQLHEIAAGGNHDVLILGRIVALLRELRPSAVHTWLLQMDVFGGAASLVAGVPWVLSERSCAQAYVQGWKFRLQRLLARRAAAVVANSSAGADCWATVRDDRVLRVIRNIVPIAAIDAEPMVKSADNAPTVVFAGRFAAEKNLPNLLRALDRALTAVPTARAILFGDGPLRGELDQLKTMLASGARIELHGYTDALWGWLKRATVTVNVSHFEGMPNVVLEAMACVSPLVVSDIPAHREILDERSALFVPTDSPEAIGNAIVACLTDANAATVRARNARAHCLSFSSAAVAEQYIEVYAAVAGARATPKAAAHR